MKNSILLLSLGFTIIFFMSSNESFAEEKQVEINLDNSLYVNDIEISFLEVDDSRCPSDVTCVWQGQVLATIQMQNKTHEIIEQFSLGYTPGHMTPYKITLVDVIPHPKSTEKPEHVAIVMISETDRENPICKGDTVLENGFCVFKIPETSDFRETSDSTSITMIIIQSLGAILIIGFIVFYAIKKRFNKKEQKLEKNE